MTRRIHEHPALELLTFQSWYDAYGWSLAASAPVIGESRAQELLDVLGKRQASIAAIADLVEYLYELGSVEAGRWALAWEMLTVDPKFPESFVSVMPALQYALDNAVLDDNDAATLRARIRIWWRCAAGEWTDRAVSIFRIAYSETMPADPDIEDQPAYPLPTRSAAKTVAAGPTLVVMPSGKATKLNNFHAQYKDLVDAALPLVVANDVQCIRHTLYAEYPHATAAVDLLTRDLREGRPVTLKPVLLVGSPGCGKSRMVRRLGDILQLFTYRFDASAASDNQFGGTSKGWANTEASVPARAVAQSKIANPIVLVDEIDKAAERNWNGRLWDSLLPFFDPETASRYRDQSLDSELNLSKILYASTANSIERLPAPLKDRFRIIRMPDPTLAHLQALAANVMRDIALEDELRLHDEPLAADELDVAGRAWAKVGFSMRKLQAIVRATLEARDQYAMRH